MSTENRRPSVVAAHPMESAGAPPAGLTGSPARVFPSSPPVSDARGPLRSAAGHAPLVLAGLAVAFTGSVPLAVAWFVASRLAYVGFVGLSLRAESRDGALSRRENPEAAWRRFSARASRVMFGDVVAFGALCIVTRATLPPLGPAWLAPVVGGLLVALGVGIKVWATKHLDEGSFYWRDFFVPPEHRNRSVSGPYRWLSNPMYTVGYAHAYGFAVLLGSGAGLAGAAFAQLAIVSLAVLVEHPHVRRFGGQ